MRFILAFFLATASIAYSQTPAAAPGAQYSATVNRYCVTCHNDKLKTANLSLEKIDVADVPAHGDIWEKVIRKVRSGAMPPLAATRPDNALRAGFVSYLEQSLDAAAAAAPNPGRPVVHRLNRAEYKAAVKDLLGLDIDPSKWLPLDTMRDRKSTRLNSSHRT